MSLSCRALRWQGTGLQRLRMAATVATGRSTRILPVVVSSVQRMVVPGRIEESRLKGSVQQQMPHRCFSSVPSSSSSSSSSYETPKDSAAAVSSSSSSSPSSRHHGISDQDVVQEEHKRTRLRDVKISEVLKAKHSYRWVDPVISSRATVREAIVTTIDGGLSGMMVVDDASHHCVGLLTSRDLLRIMASGIKLDWDNDTIMSQCVGDFMTPLDQVIFGRPEETIGMCRTIMAKLGIKCLPILSKQGRVEGLLTARDMSDYGLTAKEKGGKEAYLKDVSTRVGLSSNTSMADPPMFLKAHLALEQTPLFVNMGVAALPHPFKAIENGRRSLPDIHSTQPSKNPDTSEDAFFCTRVSLPDEKDKILRDFTYMGVADGVGSWREYGIDPREFSRRLMEECQNILQEASGRNDGHQFRQVIAPAQVMAQAYERVKAENIVGSCTACIALFDGLRHQLHFSNLGDSGLIVLRHIDSDVAGSLKRDRGKPRYDRTSDLRVSFVSQQQLRSFNHPYQLGWTGEEIKTGEVTSFKTAKDACTTSIHLRRGDIIIIATDGLFDNVELDDICEIALDWENRHGFIRGGDISARERRWAMGNSLSLLSSESIDELSHLLCQRALENSLSKDIDSPFAILAKENDIMWSGGMPDDCTILALHIVGRDPSDLLDKTNM